MKKNMWIDPRLKKGVKNLSMENNLHHEGHIKSQPG
jgi:hypothetical protein